MTAAEYLLRVLRGFVQGTDPGPFDGNWRELNALAGIHSVQGILGHSVMSYPHPDSEPVAQVMRQECMHTMLQFSRRADAMERLSAQLSGEDIDHLLFKGYVVRNCYPVPELRTYGDIDFLIRKEDRARCHVWMLRQGFQTKTDWEPVYSYIRANEYYEIHTEVLEVDVSDKADYRGYFQRIWDYARPVGEHVYELTPEYHLLYLLTHIAKHISSSGAGIRMYLDIAFYLRHFQDTLDWSWFCDELERLHFTDFVNMTFSLVERCFGVQSPIPLRPVESQVMQDFIDFTMEGGTFGHFGRDASVVQLKKQDRNEENVSRGKTLLHRIFPSAATIERRYTYLQGRHWLLPVAWADRLVRNRALLGKRIQESHDILTADESEVLKLKRLYKEIGL